MPLKNRTKKSLYYKFLRDIIQKQDSVLFEEGATIFSDMLNSTTEISNFSLQSSQVPSTQHFESNNDITNYLILLDFQRQVDWQWRSYLIALLTGCVALLTTVSL